MRTAYLLTCNSNSPRTQFSKNVLERVGFSVTPINCLPNDDKVLSNKYSMLHIYDLIANGDDEWAYVFEDDVNVLEDITLDELIEYEKVSKQFFYLGVCIYGDNKLTILPKPIRNNIVYNVKQYVRGLHAIALSKEGASNLLSFSNDYTDFRYMDMILEKFCERYTANVVRFDLESYISRHRGLFFQDRDRFPSSIP